MADTYWLKQTPGKPLFPDILWSRPETKVQAGKLLIIGGNAHSFSAVSRAYDIAARAGTGTVRAVLPNILQKTLGKVFPDAEFAPSNLSGGFSSKSLAQLLDNASWADGVLLAGDFGKNSETAILLESFSEKYIGPLTISGDSVDYFFSNKDLLMRPTTNLVADFSQLQKLMAQQAYVLKSSMNLIQLVDKLHVWTREIKLSICTVYLAQIICAQAGQVATTAASAEPANLSPYAAAWQLWQPAKAFQAICTAVYEIALNNT